MYEGGRSDIPEVWHWLPWLRVHHILDVID